MSRDATAGLVGAVFGLVFVLVNAGGLASPFDLLVRVLAVVAFVSVFLLLRRGVATPMPDAGQRALRIYAVAVAAELVALFGGTLLLRNTGHEELSLPWVVIVVGVHFVPLGWAFRARFFHVLAGVLVALGVAGAVLALAGASSAAVSFVSGVGAGATLLAFAALPSLARPVRT
jgi:hypothetical protein